MPTSVPPHSLESALAYVQDGGRLAIPTAYRITIIEQKHVDSFTKAGTWLLKEDGDGYRLKMGKGSVYILPGQLQFA
jgi:hypothetical protein